MFIDNITDLGISRINKNSLKFVSYICKIPYELQLSQTIGIYTIV